MKTNDNKADSYVTIVIRENKRTVLTDEQDSFTITKLLPGTYHLELSLTGYESQEQAITIRSGVEETVSFRLQLSEKQLEDVTVVSNRSRFVKPVSLFVAKMPLKNIANTQTYTTVTSALLEDQFKESN